MANIIKCLFGYHDYSEVWKLDVIREVHICHCQTVARMIIYDVNDRRVRYTQHGKVLASDNRGIVVKIWGGIDRTTFRLEWWTVNKGRKLYVLVG